MQSESAKASVMRAEEINPGRQTHTYTRREKERERDKRKRENQDSTNIWKKKKGKKKKKISMQNTINEKVPSRACLYV